MVCTQHGGTVAQGQLTKIQSADAAAKAVQSARAQGNRVVFTNGCFDLIHAGHTRYLAQARDLGDVLVVGLNSDDSVRSLNKGEDRPLVPAAQRAEVLAALAAVDLVVVFEESTPLRLIEALQPDVLVKGGDWAVADIVGAEVVQARGGEVHSLPLVEGLSTTELLRRIRSSQA